MEAQFLPSSTAGTRAFKLASGVIGFLPLQAFSDPLTMAIVGQRLMLMEVRLLQSAVVQYILPGGVYSSKDSGATWAAVDTAELGITFSALVAEGTHLFLEAIAGASELRMLLPYFGPQIAVTAGLE